MILYKILIIIISSIIIALIIAIIEIIKDCRILVDYYKWRNKSCLKK